MSNQNTANGPPSGGMGMQHGQAAQPPAPAQSMSQQNLNQIVRTAFLLRHVQCFCKSRLWKELWKGRAQYVESVDKLPADCSGIACH